MSDRSKMCGYVNGFALVIAGIVSAALLASCTNTGGKKIEITEDVHGVVFDVRTNDPIAGASVVSHRDGELSYATSDQRGRFFVPPVEKAIVGDALPESLVESPHSAEVVAAGYKSQRTEFSRHPNHICPDVPNPLVIKLSPDNKRR